MNPETLTILVLAGVGLRHLQQNYLPGEAISRLLWTPDTRKEAEPQPVNPEALLVDDSINKSQRDSSTPTVEEPVVARLSPTTPQEDDATTVAKKVTDDAQHQRHVISPPNDQREEEAAEEESCIEEARTVSLPVPLSSRVSPPVLEDEEGLLTQSLRSYSHTPFRGTSETPSPIPAAPTPHSWFNASIPDLAPMARQLHPIILNADKGVPLAVTSVPPALALKPLGTMTNASLGQGPSFAVPVPAISPPAAAGGSSLPEDRAVSPWVNFSSFNQESSMQDRRTPILERPFASTPLGGARFASHGHGLGQSFAGYGASLAHPSPFPLDARTQGGTPTSLLLQTVRLAAVASSPQATSGSPQLRAPTPQSIPTAGIVSLRESKSTTGAVNDVSSQNLSTSGLNGSMTADIAALQCSVHEGTPLLRSISKPNRLNPTAVMPRLVIFDLDDTLIRRFLSSLEGNRFCSDLSLKEREALFFDSVFFREFCQMCAAHGHQLRIASHTDGCESGPAATPPWNQVSVILDGALHSKRSYLVSESHIACWHSHHGKNPHIEQFLQCTEKSGEGRFDMEQVILIDDHPNNVSKARAAGYHGFLVEKGQGFDRYWFGQQWTLSRLLGFELREALPSRSVALSPVDSVSGATTTTTTSQQGDSSPTWLQPSPVRERSSPWICNSTPKLQSTAAVLNLTSPPSGLPGPQTIPRYRSLGINPLDMQNIANVPPGIPSPTLIQADSPAATKRATSTAPSPLAQYGSIRRERAFGPEVNVPPPAASSSLAAPAARRVKITSPKPTPHQSPAEPSLMGAPSFKRSVG